MPRTPTSFRLSDRERASLERLARVRRISPSELVRAALRRFSATDTPAAESALKQLAEIAAIVGLKPDSDPAAIVDAVAQLLRSLDEGLDGDAAAGAPAILPDAQALHRLGLSLPETAQCLSLPRAKQVDYARLRLARKAGRHVL